MEKLFSLTSVFILILHFSVLTQDLANQERLFELQSETTVSAKVNQWYFFPDRTVAITSQEINFYQTGVLQTIPLPELYLKTVFSRNGYFFANVTLSPRESIEAIDRDLSISVFATSNPGVELYNLTRKVHFDRTLPSISLSGTNGSLILGENDTGELWFYDQNGNLINQLLLFPDAGYDLEKILDVDISEDGSRVAVVAGKRGASPEGSGALNPSAEPHLFYFTGEGQEIWRRALPGLNSNEVAISSDGQFIIANSFTISIEGQLSKRSVFFNSAGLLILEADILFKQARFSTDSHYVVLADNHQLQMFNLRNEKFLWSHELPRKDGIIVDGDVSGITGNSAIMIAQNFWDNDKFICVDPQLLFYDQSGKLLQKIDYRDQQVQKPAVRFSKNGELLMVGLNTQFQVYRIK